MHWYTLTKSTSLPVSNDVKVIVTLVAPATAMIQVQFELLAYGDSPDPSENEPPAAVNTLHDAAQPVQGKPSCHKAKTQTSLDKVEHAACKQYVQKCRITHRCLRRCRCRSWRRILQLKAHIGMSTLFRQE